MDASLFATTLTEVLKYCSYEDLQRGWTENYSLWQTATEIGLLDLVGKDLQDLAEAKVDQCGHIILFLTPDTYQSVIDILDQYGLDEHIHNLRSRVDFSNPENFYFIAFS